MITKFNKRVQIQKYDAEKEEYVSIAEVWSCFKKPRMSSVIVASNPTSLITFEIVIRNRKDIRKDFRIVYDDRIFNVLYSFDSDDMSETNIICTEFQM